VEVEEAMVTGTKGRTEEGTIMKTQNADLLYLVDRDFSFLHWFFSLSLASLTLLNV